MDEAGRTLLCIQEARRLGPSFLRALMILFHRTGLTQMLPRNRTGSWEFTVPSFCLFVFSVVHGGSS